MKKEWEGISHMRILHLLVAVLGVTAVFVFVLLGLNITLPQQARGHAPNPSAPSFEFTTTVHLDDSDLLLSVLDIRGQPLCSLELYHEGDGGSCVLPIGPQYYRCWVFAGDHECRGPVADGGIHP